MLLAADQPCFPFDAPHTLAGLAAEIDETEERRRSHYRRPPSRRPGHAAMRVTHPFGPDWPGLLNLPASTLQEQDANATPSPEPRPTPNPNPNANPNPPASTLPEQDARRAPSARQAAAPEPPPIGSATADAAVAPAADSAAVESGSGDEDGGDRDGDSGRPGLDGGGGSGGSDEGNLQDGSGGDGGGCDGGGGDGGGDGGDGAPPLPVMQFCLLQGELAATLFRSSPVQSTPVHSSHAPALADGEHLPPLLRALLPRMLVRVSIQFASKGRAIAPAAIHVAEHPALSAFLADRW